MDPFKKYIQENREAVDADAPRPIVWERIEKELPAPAKRISINRVIIWSAAACVLVLAGIGITRFARNEIRDTSSGLRDKSYKLGNVAGNKLRDTSYELRVTGYKLRDVASNTKPVTRIPNSATRNPNPETRISELESSFTQVINLQKARISTTPMYAESAAYFNDFKVEMRQMEKDEAQIKKDISTRGMTNELLDQLINIYQQKLNMLKQLQLEMQKTNNRYKQNRVSVDTVRTYFLSI
ncbi:MAG: hypothetical protein K2X26_05240 [Chitinophagaceae bacterium]|nr:hypothetical protein [Chitinophagaceae bacterium]